MTRILGISALYHDSAAAFVEDGRIVAAAQEERFTRTKHDASFPANAIRYCLEEAGVSLAEVDHIAFYDKPFLKFERLLETYMAFAPRGLRSFAMAMPVWLREKLFQKDLLISELKKLDPDARDIMSKMLFTEHHLSHAASAFYPSPFDEAAVVTIDGVGEWATTTIGHGKGSELDMLQELHFPHSLGLLYSAFTYYCGFKVNSGEYKLMGLAPYGEPKYASLIRDHLIDLKADGSFRLNLDYFDYCTGLTMTNNRFDALFGQPIRPPESQLDQFHMDMAASVQLVTEEAVFALVREAVKLTGSRNLCLAGGVALNCVANGKILAEGLVDGLWIQPAAGDAGGALGAALAAAHLHLDLPRANPNGRDAMQGAYLGPSFPQDEVEARLTAAGARFEVLADEAALVDRTAQDLSTGKAIGWMQGRMEYGPRSLGARSILGDPRDRNTQRDLNLKIKYRESFRPFAPVVLRDKVSDWFELDADSPYMLLVAPVAEKQLSEAAKTETAEGFERLKIARSTIPAVTHVDGSARVQTVQEETNPRFNALLKSFEAKTGCPVLVNTSFNIRSEPIVCSPEDAFRCFMGCELDVLVVGNCYLEKSGQDPALKTDYRGEFELD